MADPHWRDPHCPKHMLHGPCGGVTDGGDCEVPGVRCPFVPDDGRERWHAPPASAGPVDVPEFVIDLRPDPSQLDELTEVAGLLDPAYVAVLIGDHVDEADGYDPSEMAEAIIDAGIRAIVTLSCRSRSVAALTAHISRMQGAGVETVHCVTGDHPAARLGRQGDDAFPLDSFGLVGLARSLGVAVSVAESPAAQPRARRPERLAAKARAGASVGILNHAGDIDALIEFARQCHALHPAIDLVAPVPVITDHRSAQSLAQFPGLVLPPGLTDRVLEASDPMAEGIDAAIDIGCQLRSSGHFAALNLSGSGANLPIPERCELMASIADAIRAST